MTISTVTTSVVQQNLQDVRQRISAAAERCGRAPEEITL
ncbi:YggS family pyridoxal phosphate enzyme, partial [Pseudomonas syringae pv. actinidiae]|nr:YggS family pyridoxal phosphate enzyme [Pseudomonas syringae pv. actinidiae]